MGISATQLGALFGRGGAAMNVLLHEHGFIEGGPGAWSPTEFGEQFAKLVEKDNGYGGFAQRACCTAWLMTRAGRPPTSAGKSRKVLLVRWGRAGPGRPS